MAGMLKSCAIDLTLNSDTDTSQSRPEDSYSDSLSDELTPQASSFSSDPEHN